MGISEVPEKLDYSQKPKEGKEFSISEFKV